MAIIVKIELNDCRNHADRVSVNANDVSSH